jgi:hypothetical protein
MRFLVIGCLNLSSDARGAYSAIYTIKKRCIFLTRSIYMVFFNLTISSDYFPKPYKPIDVYNGGGFHSL